MSGVPAPSPSPTGPKTPYAVLSFDPVHVNSFRIGAGWNNANSRIPCAPRPGTVVNSVWRVAESPAEDFDPEDVAALADVMKDDFARSLLGIKLEQAGYPHKFGFNQGDSFSSDILQVIIWEANDGTATSGMFKRFNTTVRTEYLQNAHCADCDINQGVDGYFSGTTGADHVEVGAKGGYASAQHLLGQMYLHGVAGLEVNRALGEEWIQKAALQGHVHAMYMEHQFSSRSSESRTPFGGPPGAAFSPVSGGGGFEIGRDFRRHT